MMKILRFWWKIENLKKNWQIFNILGYFYTFVRGYPYKNVKNDQFLTKMTHFWEIWYKFSLFPNFQLFSHFLKLLKKFKKNWGKFGKWTMGFYSNEISLKFDPNFGDFRSVKPRSQFLNFCQFLTKFQKKIHLGVRKVWNTIFARVQTAPKTPQKCHCKGVPLLFYNFRVKPRSFCKKCVILL